MGRMGLLFYWIAVPLSLLAAASIAVFAWRVRRAPSAISWPTAKRLAVLTGGLTVMALVRTLADGVRGRGEGVFWGCVVTLLQGIAFAAALLAVLSIRSVSPSRSPATNDTERSH